jgi:predicted phosphodiesterase
LPNDPAGEYLDVLRHPEVAWHLLNADIHAPMRTLRAAEDSSHPVEFVTWALPSVKVSKMPLRWILAAFWALSIGSFADEAPLVRVGEIWQFFRGFTEPTLPALSWTRSDFIPDTNWLSGISGFCTPHGNRDDENVLLYDRPYNYVAACFRREFVVQDPASIHWLTLRLDYQEGFVAYLNGVEIARRNLDGAPGVPVPIDAIAGTRTNLWPEEFDVSAAASGLVAGVNVLAIQVHSDQLTPGFPFSVYGGDLKCVAELLANFQRGPFVQNVSATSAQILWKTPVPASSWVEFRTADGVWSQIGDDTLTTNHVIALTGLSPNTPYDYRVSSAYGNATAVAPVATFRTFKLAGNLSFAVLGDSGQGSTSQYRTAALLRTNTPDLVMHCGDIVYSAFNPERADTRCLSVYGAHMRTTPYFFVLGNHDTYWSPYAKPATDAFALPTNNVPLEVHLADKTSPEHYYSFDHGDAHFVVLFSPSVSFYKFATLTNTQMLWLEADLAATTKPWKFLFMHMPVNTSSAHRFDDADANDIYDRIELQETLLPLAQKYGVQVMFAGHDHCFERFVPVGGVHMVTTGAGGVALYGASEWDLGSAQFYAVHHFVKVDITGETLLLRAITTNGVAFDGYTIQRRPPTPRTYTAPWATARVEDPPPKPAVLNIQGQSYDFSGEPIQSFTGQFANLGLLRASLDRANLYLGFERVMVSSNADVVLFVESPRQPGVGKMEGLGNGVFDPEGQGIEALDTLENLAFLNFSPSIACVLGDEMADGTYRDFQRTNAPLAMGQGVFRLNADFSDVPGARIQQFDRWPQFGASRVEQSADFIEVAIPRAALGNLKAEDTIRVAAVACRGPESTNATVRWIDTGFIGAQMIGSGTNAVSLEGLAIRLPADPDRDADGISNADELKIGTNPDLADTDGDGLNDGWELAHHFNPFLTTGADGGQGDPDNDGLTNIEEQALQTDPRNAASTLRMTIVALPDGAVRLGWSALPSRVTVLEVSSGYGAAFTTLLQLDPRDTPLGAEEHYDLPPAEAAQFFRLRLK